MKRLLPILIVAILGGIYIGYRMYNKEHPDLMKVKADHTMTTAELIKAYDGSDASATMDGTVVDITGTIAEVSTSPEGHVRQFSLVSDDVMTAVSLLLDEEAVGAKQWKAGDKGTWRCRCDGKLIDIELVRCVEKQ